MDTMSIKLRTECKKIIHIYRESRAEVLEAMEDMIKAGVDVLTLGQVRLSSSTLIQFNCATPQYLVEYLQHMISSKKIILCFNCLIFLPHYSTCDPLNII